MFKERKNQYMCIYFFVYCQFFIEVFFFTLKLIFSNNPAPLVRNMLTGQKIIVMPLTNFERQTKIVTQALIYGA